MTDTADVLIVSAVVAARLLSPLLIFRFPLAGILASLVIDALDQTIFQQSSSLQLEAYQGYDKALDVYYLSLAYISTMRNWIGGHAFAIGRFLFYFRLVGVAAFELTDAKVFVLLFVFPNTFEFFFILYELLRSRWAPVRWSGRFWALSAAGIWIFVKLPQEYWLHIAKLDTTDLAGAHPRLAVAIGGAATVLLGVGWLIARPRLRPADHSVAWRADPLPREMDELQERLAYRVRRGRLFDLWLLEKVVLIVLVSVTYVQILPGSGVSTVQMTLFVAGLVVVNAGLGLETARRGRGFASVAVTFVALAAVNIAITVVARELRQAANEAPASISLFCVLLLTLMVVLYDQYRPVLDARSGRLGVRDATWTGTPGHAIPHYERRGRDSNPRDE